MTGNDLKAFREGLGWSQTRLAGYLGIPQPKISKYERAGDGSIPARASTVDRLKAKLEEFAKAER